MQTSLSPAGYTTSGIIKAFGERLDNYIKSASPNYTKFDLPVLAGINKTDLQMKKWSDIEMAFFTQEGQEFNETQKQYLGAVGISPVKYGLKRSITTEAEIYSSSQDVSNVLGSRNFGAELADSLIKRRDSMFTNIFLNANQSFGYKAYDGVPLASNSHPYINSDVTNDNLMDNKALDDDTWEEANRMMDNFRLSDGFQLGGGMGDRRVLVVCRGSRNVNIAKKMDMSELNPFSANNAANVDKGLQYIVLDNVPTTYKNHWWLVNIDRMKEFVFRAVMIDNRIVTQDTRKDFGIENTWIAQAIDTFVTVDWSWLVMTPATTTL